MTTTSVRPIPSRAKYCRYCHSQLSFTQSIAGDVCDNINCRLLWRADFATEVTLREQQKEAQERELMERANNYRNSLVEQYNLDIGKNAVISVVPANERNITRLQEYRIDDFSEYLRDCISQAYTQFHGDKSANTHNPQDTDSVINSTSELERETLLQSCSACKGSCCLSAASTYAYQDVDNMKNYVKANSDKDVDTILGDYLAHIPELSYENSCVYHTESGCHLPRHMRAEICNQHLCKGLKRIKLEFEEEDGEPDSFFIVASNTYKIIRTRLINKSLEVLDFGNKSSTKPH